MKFYVDFEATQFTERVIAIGCVCENGKSFRSMVRLCKGDKLTPFITQLTGITEEMLENAPTVDEAFRNFFYFVAENCNGEAPEYYCYGNTDVRFIKQTVKKMTDFLAITFATSMASLLQDYSVVVKNFFKTGPLGLFRVYSFMLPEAPRQSHDPLEDAIMLQYIEKNLREKCQPNDFLPQVAPEKVNRPDKVQCINNRNPKIPSIFYDWDGQAPFKIVTGATAENYVVEVRHFKKNTVRIQYFNNMEEAVIWDMKFGNNKFSPKNEAHYRKAEKEIRNASKSGCKASGFYWQVKENA